MESLILGVDIGGTSIKVGLFEERTLLRKWSLPTRVDETGSQIIPDLAESMRNEMTPEELDALAFVGLDFPGHMFGDGRTCEAVNINWKDYPLLDEIDKYIGKPAIATNDANAACLAEGWMGAAEGCPDYVMVTLGTGVGGGIVANGKLISGRTGSAGEIGHITINPDEEIACNCGNHGCLEQYAAAPGFVRWASEAVKNSDKESSLKGKESMEAKDFFDAASEGDELALELVDRYAHYLGLGLGSIGSVMDPEVFVIGGGIAQAGMYLIDAVAKYYREHVYPGARDARFVMAKLKNDAGICGAAKLALDALEES